MLWYTGAMKNLRVIILTITLLVFSFGAPLATYGYQFDPGGQIADTLNLPTRDTESTVIATVQYLLALLGLISVIMVLYGGFRYLTSAGNEETITRSKTIIKAAVVGLAIILLAEALLITVVEVVNNVAQ